MPEKSTGYGYTNTRIRAMQSKLLIKSDFEKLLKMSLAEIARFLGDTDYRREIDELGMRYSGANLIEYALSRNMANTFRKVHDFAIRDARKGISAYLKKWDVWNIKLILRGKFANAPNEQILIGLVPAGMLRAEFLREVVETSTSINGAVEKFKKTEYYSTLSANSQNLAALEDALDRKYYADAAKDIPDEVKPFIRLQIDTANTLNKMRAEKAEIKLELLEGGSKKPPQLPKSAAIEEARVSLPKTAIAQGRRMLHDFRRTLKPVIGYFSAKENEVRNLRMIARAKQANLPMGVVESQLVI